MRSPISIFAVLILAAGAAHAQVAPGLALRWNHCFAQGTGTDLRSFACNTNNGLEQLIGSFSLNHDMPEVSGLDIILDVFTGGNPFFPPAPNGGPLPEWWKFVQVGTCRQTSLSISTAADPVDDACGDWAAGQAAGALGAYTVDIQGAGSARLHAVTAVLPDDLQALVAGREYYGFTLNINHSRTVGAGSCGGCDTPVWLLFHVLTVTTPQPQNNFHLEGPLNGTDSNFVIWSPQPVPTKSATWSALKSLYR